MTPQGMMNFTMDDLCEARRKLAEAGDDLNKINFYAGQIHALRLTAIRLGFVLTPDKDPREVYAAVR